LSSGPVVSGDRFGLPGREMADLTIEARNSLDGRIYYASIVPKYEVTEYWLAPTLSPGEKKPHTAHVTLKATATAKSLFARKTQPLLFICYGIGRLEFDTFYALVQQVLSTCDMSAMTSVTNTQAIDEICARYGLMADHGEFREPRSSRPIPFLMLFDRNADARGY
jgi:hypothetical protein